MDRIVSIISWSPWKVYPTAVRPCCPVWCSANLPSKYSFPPPFRVSSRFNSSQEYITLLLSKLEAEHGFYFTPPSTYSGDPYG